MGSCISKCMPNTTAKHSKFDHDNDYDFVQDKLVISSRAPPFDIPPTPLSTKISSFPSNNSSSSKSTSSSQFTISRSSISSISNNSSSNSSTSSCSSFSTASSGPSPKDRSTFSNDFLLSCIKENPHILHINGPDSIKASYYPILLPGTVLVASPSRESVLSPSRWQNIPQKAPSPGPAMQKRVRPSSPNLTRKKSMRVTTEHNGLTSPHHRVPTRVSRSPSPSRRFEPGLDKSRGTFSATPTNRSVRPMSPSTSRRIGPASPNNFPNAVRIQTGIRESFAHQIGAKVEEIASKFSSTHDVDSADDDVNNPLISLDCFIFL